MRNAEDIRLWEAFGSWITAKRLLLGLTQPEVAARAGVDPQTLYRYEKGQSTKASTVRKLAKALQLDENEALQRAGFTRRAEAITNNPSPNALTAEIAKQLDPEALAIWLAVGQLIANRRRPEMTETAQTAINTPLQPPLNPPERPATDTISTLLAELRAAEKAPDTEAQAEKAALLRSLIQIVREEETRMTGNDLSKPLKNHDPSPSQHPPPKPDPGH